MIDDTLVAEYTESGSSGGSGDGIEIELDDVYNTYVEDGVSQVRTSFNPGDEAYFRVNLRNDLQLSSYNSTDGTITYLGTETRTIRKQVFFTELEQVESLGYYIDNLDEDPHWGEIDPDFTLKDDRSSIINNLEEPNIFLLSYTVTFHIFRLTPPNLDDFFPAEDPNPNELDFEDSYPIGITVETESI